VFQRLEEIATDRSLPEPLVENVRSHLLTRLRRVEAVAADEDERGRLALRDEIEGLLIDTERRHIFGQLERGELIDEARRHIERELDLREAELLRNIPGAVNFED